MVVPIGLALSSTDRRRRPAKNRCDYRHCNGCHRV